MANFFQRLFGMKPRTDDVTLMVHRLSALEALTSEEREYEFLPVGSTGLGIVPALRTGEVDEEGGLERTAPMRNADLDARGLSLTTALQAASVEGSEALRVGGLEGGLYAWHGLGVQIVAIVGQNFAGKVSGAPVAMFPIEGTALLTGSDNLAGLEKMIGFAEGLYEEDEDRAVSLRAISWKGESACAWLPPEGHPLRQRFKLGAAKARLREAHELEIAWGAGDLPLVPLEVDEAHGELVAGWVRGSTVLMPRPDRVVLFDTNDTALPRLEVDFATLQQALPQCFTSLADELNTGLPRVLRAIGMTFPTVTEREFLRERMAFQKQVAGPRALESVEAAVLLARFDAGEPILAQAAVEPAGAVHLVSPDFKQAFVSREQFDGRMQRRRPHEQQRYALSFAVMEDVRGELGLGGSDPQAQSTALGSILSGHDERQVLVASADLDFYEAQAALLTSNTPAHLEGIAALWSPARLRPVVRVSRQAPSRTVRVFSREANEGFRVEVETTVEGESSLLFQASQTRDRSEEVWRTALLNLRAATLGALQEVEPGVFADPRPGELPFSRVFLMTDLVTACRVEGRPLVFAPLPWCVLVTGSDDAKGLAYVMAQIDAVFAEFDQDDVDDLLVGWAWTVEGDTLVRAKVPPAVESWMVALCARIESLRAG